jgi:succinate-semialdehyde dehydrogenase/glutarate-semialdehyde dehydrogenase
MEFVSVNPATAKKIRTYRPFTAAQLERALSRADRTFQSWRAAPVSARLRPLKKLSAVLHRHADRLAALACAEMGKPIAQAKAEVEKCRTLCAYYAKHAESFLADVHLPDAPRNARVSYEPLGVILAIMPWNFPFWQVLRAALPALTAGNTVLLKHSPNVSGCALAIEALFAEAGFPAGCYQTLLLPHARTPAVIEDPRVQGVTLTGSTRAGRIVGAQAGHAMKKAVFELGGSDAYLVLEDADLDRAAEICAASRLLNSGQSCVCAKRFIVVNSVRAAFEAKLTARMQTRVVGDPTLPTTQIGPIARQDLRAELQRQVEASVRAGARVLLGGQPLPGPGYFYPPTVLTGVKAGMPAYHEELFGPVAAVIGVPNAAAAIQVANSSIYGLGAAIFSRNLAKARRLAHQIEAGQVFINDNVRSDPSLPFGGVKLSGHGRELGPFGLREFVNIKTICVTSG